jgi:hypothetical protein
MEGLVVAPYGEDPVTRFDIRGEIGLEPGLER